MIFRSLRDRALVRGVRPALATSDLPDGKPMLEFGIACIPTDRFHRQSSRSSRLDDPLRSAMTDQRLG